MREILFRGKTEAGAWVYGGIAFQEDGEVVIVGALDKYQSLYDMGINSDYVIPETVGQFTGLTDKNGKRIFEGDIVRWDGDEISQIRFCEGVFRLCNAKGYYGVAIHNHYSYVEVIGNIHDNPELLTAVGADQKAN